MSEPTNEDVERALSIADNFYKYGTTDHVWALDVLRTEARRARWAFNETSELLEEVLKTCLKTE